MPTTDPRSWAYHADFAEIVVNKDQEVALRLLEAADIALTFARALVAEDYERANAMLSAGLKSSCPANMLQQELEKMIHYSGDESAWPTRVLVVTASDS